MSDLYIKPGNQERGWNDPPQFSYGLQTAQGSGPKRLLNKRVPPPQLSGPQSPSPGIPPPLSGATPANPAAPPSCGMTPPPPPSCMTSSLTPPPPPSCMTSSLTPPPRPSPRIAQTDSPSTDSEAEPSVDEVVGLLQWALTACRTSVKKQVCEDVDKRLKVFEDMWKSGKLSLPVKKRMNLLVQEMKSRNWDAADDIHRSLMVDHVNEVSQWMVGVKRLIAETRNLQPEHLCAADAEQPQSSQSDDPNPE